MTPKCGNIACLGGVRRARVRSDAPPLRLRRQRSSLRDPREPFSHEPPTSRPRFPVGNALVAQGLGARGHHRGNTSVQCMRPPVRAPPAPRPRARAARFLSFSFGFSNEALRLVFGSPFLKHALFLRVYRETRLRRARRAPAPRWTATPFRPVARSRSVAPSRHTSFRSGTGTSAAGSARGARPSTASPRRKRNPGLRLAPRPPPSSGSGATGATAGRTCPASSPTTPRAWGGDARWRSPRRAALAARRTTLERPRGARTTALRVARATEATSSTPTATRPGRRRHFRAPPARRAPSASSRTADRTCASAKGSRAARKRTRKRTRKRGNARGAVADETRRRRRRRRRRLSATRRARNARAPSLGPRRRSRKKNRSGKKSRSPGARKRLCPRRRLRRNRVEGCARTP